MRDLLRGYAAAVFDSAAKQGDIGRVATELATFIGVLVDSDLLREAMVDIAIPAQARRGVVFDLLDGKATDETRDLVCWAVLTAPPAELPAELSALDETAQAIADAARSGLRPAAAEELLGGRTAVRERIRGYAERLFQESESPEDVDLLEAEVVGFAHVVADNPQLRRALSDGTTPVEQRAGLVSELVRGRVEEPAARLLRYAVAAGNVRDLVGTLEWTAGLAAEERGRRVAQVRSAVALDDEEVRRLTETLTRSAGRPVELRVHVDPTLLGGMEVAIGDTVIDGSVRHRLERLRESLMKAAAQPLEARQ